MAKTKDEAIFITIDDKIIELTGKDKEVFLEDKKAAAEEIEIHDAKIKAKEELKIAAYKKLGLTDEEINAIL